MPRIVDMLSKPNTAFQVCADEFDSMSDEEQSFLRDLAERVRDALKERGEVAAWRLANDNLLQDEQLALWSLFTSKERAALKRGCNESR